MVSVTMKPIPVRQQNHSHGLLSEGKLLSEMEPSEKYITVLTNMGLLEARQSFLNTQERAVLSTLRHLMLIMH